MKVVVSDPMFIRYADILRISGNSEDTWHFFESFDETALCHALVDADIYVGYRFTKAMAEAAASLRFIQASGAGLDRIALDALRPGVMVANTYNHERAIAEYILMVMLAFTRDLLQVDRQLRQGVWASISYNPAASLHQTLRGQVVGLVGFGHVGVEFARLAECFGIRTIAIKRSPQPELCAEYGLDFLGGPSDLPELLLRSDFVVLAAPLNEETRGMFGQEQLNQMRKSAYLINIARAALVDESALYHALTERHIAGAALDVWYNYPTEGYQAMPAAQPFHTLDNVLLTPHNSGTTEETLRRRALDFATNIERVQAGQLPLNLVHPRAAGATHVES